MRTYSNNFGPLEQATEKEPRFVYQQSWDDADTDHTYFTSGSEAQTPVGADVIASVFQSVSGQTQKINPDIATSTIGAITVRLLDDGEAVTNKIAAKLAALKGMRGKIGRVYVGYHDIDFTDYDLRVTFIVDEASYLDGVYVVKLKDIQRTTKQNIFSPHATTLNQSIGAADMVIPITGSDLTRFPTVEHGSEYTTRPGETLSYGKIGDEVFAHTGLFTDATLGPSFAVVERGALNTRAVEHVVDASKEDNRKPKITEHIFLEGAAPKIIYALNTGLLVNGINVLDDPFDFSQWGVSASAPVVTALTIDTPVGWGVAYSVSDADAGAVAYLVSNIESATYVHGDEWSISVYVLKEVVANSSRFDIDFTSGAATSEIRCSFDASTGVFSASGTAATVTASSVVSFNDAWWHLSLSGYSTTTGTTGVLFQVFPAISSVADTGSVTLFCASLTKSAGAGLSAMPLHWHLGIATAFVKLADFQSLGDDYWNTTDNTGRFVRIENPGSQTGKRYIEKELLLWLGAFSPIYADGSIGIKRLSQVLSESSHDVVLGTHNVKSYSSLTQDMNAVINHIKVNWNWVDSKQDYTKTTDLIDAKSISVHGQADVKKYTFKTVHTGLHTDEDLLTYLDVLRDRYSGPPQLISVDVLPSLSRLEVGDTVRLSLPQVRDCNTGATLDRTFEVQQVSTDWMNGNIKLSLFGSSMKAGELSRTALSSVLNDTFYADKGTELSTVLTISAGAVTANGTLTGHATDIDNAAAIYYYDGDLTIDAGVTVTIGENVQLRIKGSLQINGDINGVANGATGGTATVQFKNGTTSYTYNLLAAYGAIVPRSPPDYNEGTGGYFGTTISPGNIWSYGYLVADPLPGSIVQFPAHENISTGQVSAVPFYQLSNNATFDLITGYPGDLRGKSGISGEPLINIGTIKDFYNGTEYIIANGGAGGNGGAGLLIIARSMAFGVSGFINLSGGDSSAGSSYTHPTTGDIFYGTSGAPGAPGALLLLLDGNATNPDIDSNKFVANYGDTVVAAGATEIGGSDLQALTGIIDARRFDHWPWPNSVYNLPPYNATELISCSAAAHRIIYIPPDATVQEEVQLWPADVTGFSALQNGAVVVFVWDANPDVVLAGYEIRYGARGASTWADASPITEVTKGTSITTANVPPGDWTFYIKAVNDAANDPYSQNAGTSNLVVTNELDIIAQVEQAPDWLGTLTNFVKHHTGVLVPKSQNLASADGWETFDTFVINPYAVCTYEAPEFDISFDDSVRVWGDIQSALGPGVTAGTASPKLSIDYKLAAGAYDGFENWSVGDATLRYCKHKLTLNTVNGIAKITGFLPTVDILEHKLSDSAVAIAGSGGSTITFSTAFHTAPFVRVFVDASSALIPVRSNITATGFDAQVFDTSGTDVGGTISWEATGS